MQYNGEGQGSAGEDWLLLVRCKVVDGLLSCDNLKAVFALCHERLVKVLQKFVLLTVKKGKGPEVSGPDDPLWPDSGPATYNYIQPTNRLFAKRHNSRKEGGMAKVRPVNRRSNPWCLVSMMMMESMTSRTCLQLILG